MARLIVKNVYVRFQCLEQYESYRYLISTDDDDLVSDLEPLGFDLSYQSENNCWNAFSLDQNGSRNFSDEIQDLLESHGYSETHKSFTERQVNLGGRHEPYRPDPNLNLLRVFCNPNIRYEVNTVYTKIMRQRIGIDS